MSSELLLSSSPGKKIPELFNSTIFGCFDFSISKNVPPVLLPKYDHINQSETFLKCLCQSVVLPSKGPKRTAKLKETRTQDQGVDNAPTGAQQGEFFLHPQIRLMAALLATSLNLSPPISHEDLSRGLILSGMQLQRLGFQIVAESVL